MGLVQIVFLALMLSGCQFNFISCEDDSIKNVKIRCYVGGSITKYSEFGLSEASHLNLQLNVSRPTMLYVHGWNENVNSSPTLSKIVSSFLTLNEHNVCVLNYKDLAEQFYTIVVDNVPLLSEIVALTLKKWVGNGVKPNQIHLIGYSIGAHVCGLIGRTLLGIGYIIGRITGLDPANPTYCTSGDIPHPNALNQSDAKFVDVIHTDSGLAGCPLALGDADFYPNGGTRPQPMCGNSFMQYLSVIVGDHCPHDASVYYFADSLQANSPIYLANNRQNKKLTAPMGYRCPTSAKGSYDLVIS